MGTEASRFGPQYFANVSCNNAEIVKRLPVQTYEYPKRRVLSVYPDADLCILEQLQPQSPVLDGNRSRPPLEYKQQANLTAGQTTKMKVPNNRK